MSKDTWNFNCWNTTDSGPGPGDRGILGMIYETGPGAMRSPNAQPFTESMTYIFSFFARTGWTWDDPAIQSIMWMGKGTQITHLHIYAVMDTAANPKVHVIVKNGSSGTVRYQIELGDEDGASWLSFDKWYQMAIAFDENGIKWAVNGTNKPKRTITTNSSGSLEMDNGSEIIWLYGGPTPIGGNNPVSVQSNWPSLVIGPAAFTTTKLDLNSATVRNRIWDNEGNFKNPGEDGSFWLGDTYSASIPDTYSPDGSLRFNRGGSMVWGSNGGGALEWVGQPGGLRKQYEP